jgi:protein-disulfide isomerase
MYVKTGVVRFGYLHFAFLGPESGWAAEASECADEQGKFWEYHDLLFARHGGENQGAFSKDNLKKFAADLKLNTGTFNTCLDSGKYASVVQADAEFLQSLGVQSTPTFLINATPIAGALPFDQFQKIIESEKAKKK